MTFNCYYRSKDGSRKEITVNSNNRKHAYQQVKDAGLNVIELCPVDNRFKNKQAQETSDINPVKIPNEEELKFLLMRKNAFWIGFVSSFFSPILWLFVLPILLIIHSPGAVWLVVCTPLLWFVACVISVCKYEMGGLSCCVTGIIAPSVPVVMGSLGLGSGISLVELGYYGSGCDSDVVVGVARLFSGIILGVLHFIVGVWISKYFYKKDVLLGFTMPSASVASRM